MQDKFEELLRIVLKRHGTKRTSEEISHPSEEKLVCFIEGRLDREDTSGLISHLLICHKCNEAIALDMHIKDKYIFEVPSELRLKIEEMIPAKEDSSLLEVYLKVKGEFLEVINTSADVLLGQEVIPASVLRTRKIANFKDEVMLLKAFRDMRVDLKVENKGKNIFNITVKARYKASQSPVKDLRINLIKDEIEIESRLVDADGTVVFEHVLLGKYIIETAFLKEHVASILLDIKAC
ncbi:MAG: hypothetical protein PHI86_07095 [Candidatus Omnitrophica bacterium]|nr:hypothetical protein [Candidatus Omnitrophota bacterium]